MMGRTQSHGLNPVTKKKGYLRAAFITLTIPDLHTVIDSKKGYSLLIKKFIQYIQYQFNVRDYIWKFEWQQRGQGHWHLFVDRFCEVDQVRKYWLECLTELSLTKDWYTEHNYEPASSCKIIGMKTEGMLSFYLNEYLSKKKQNNEATEGRIWGASMNIKKSKLPKLPITDLFVKNLERARERKHVSVREVNTGEVYKDGKIIQTFTDPKNIFWVCSIVRPGKLPVISLLCPKQRGIYDEYIKAYRRGDWEMTWELELDKGDIEKQMREWSKVNIAPTAAWSSWYKPITKKSEWEEKYQVNTEETKRYFGVSLYT
jgi:hypothetical protein